MRKSTRHAPNSVISCNDTPPQRGQSASGAEMIEPRALPAHCFEYLKLLLTYPELTFKDLSRCLEVSVASAKRAVLRLRKTGIVEVRKRDSYAVDFAQLRDLDQGPCSAIVTLELDISHLKRMPKGEPYRSEDDLLEYVVRNLPENDPWRHHIILAEGHIVMGGPGFEDVLMVHASSVNWLSRFVRTQIESLDGVRKTNTMFISASAWCHLPPPRTLLE